MSLGYSSWLIQVSEGATLSTSTLSLTSDEGVPTAISASPVNPSANLQQAELNLISIPNQASLLGSGPTLQFGGDKTNRLWIDSIQFDCVSCRKLVFECSASDSCEIILPSSESGTAAGSGVSLNFSNSAISGWIHHLSIPIQFVDRPTHRLCFSFVSSI